MPLSFAGVPAILDDLPFGALVGDKAFDADWLIEELEGRSAEAVIPPRRNRTEPREHDRDVYGWRHLVGNFFAKIKEFRAIATRHDKTDESFTAAIHLVAGVVAAKRLSTDAVMGRRFAPASVLIGTWEGC